MSSKMKIQLVNPRASVGVNYGDGVYWPTGLLSIGTYAKQHSSETDIEILDGPLIGTQQDLESRLNGDLIGITSNALNYDNVLRVAEIAKNRGSIVVVGGFHATSLARNILKNRPYIDSVINQDGERPFLEYAQGKPLNKIPNLVYRVGEDIVTNPLQIENISLGIDLDYDLLELERYFHNHGINFPDAPERTAVFFTHMGCKWREKTEGCSFCSIFHKHQRLEPKELWRKIQRLKDEYGVQGIKDYGDDFISDREWVREVTRTRPKNLRDFVISGVYASPRYLNEEVADLLKKLNVIYVYLGFESGNNGILKQANKGETVEGNYRVAEMLDRKGIKILASYVLGLEGESEQTLNETRDFARRIANLKSTQLTQAGFVVPFPGSNLCNKLIEKLPKKYSNEDKFDVDGIRKDWIKYFCNFKGSTKEAYDLIEKTSRELIDLSPLKTNYLGIEPA